MFIQIKKPRVFSIFIICIFLLKMNSPVHAAPSSVFGTSVDGNLTVTNGQTTSVGVFGTGVDGDLTVTSGQTIYTDNTRSSLAYIANSGQATLSLSSVIGFAIGQEIMIIQIQGTNTGNYEFCTIINIAGNILTLNKNLVNTYNVGGNSKALALHIPQYLDVTIQSGGKLTAHDFDSSTGGIVAFRVYGNLIINGQVSINGNKGATYTGYGIGPNTVGGGYWGGGPDTNCDDAGSCEPQYGGSSLSSPFTTNNLQNNGPGGGGGTGGTGGGGAGHSVQGINGSVWNGATQGGHGGSTIGLPALDTLFFGAGGGGGSGNWRNNGNGQSYNGAGGSGGGIIFISARKISINLGAISSNGGTGGDSWHSIADGNSAGGAGAGGSIYLKAVELTLGTNLVTASGGIGGHATSYPPNWTERHGGAGGAGRIRIEYDTLSGTTNPSASLLQVDFNSPTVTINQASNQVDPSAISPINFIAIFNEPIDLSTFTTSDITVGGTAGATTAIVSETAPHDGTTFNIAVSGMTSPGTVTAALGADKVTDLAGNPNDASASSDNSVTFIPALPLYASLAGGYEHTCMVTIDGDVKCWGDNSNGQLGDGTIQSSSSVVNVVGLSAPVVSVAATFYQTCALTEQGAVECWGLNDDGQIGISDQHISATPNPILLGGAATQVVLGNLHTCVLMATEKVMCWGDNGSGQLGNGNNINSVTSVEVSVVNRVIGIAAGDAHTCAWTLDGQAYCWGSNYYGQLGNGLSGGYSNVPVFVSGITGKVIAMTAGNGFTCVLNDSHAVQCWGDNILGQLGNGSNASSTSPVDVSGLSGGVISIAAGGGFACALLNSGGIKCWGFNDWGGLGNGSTGNIFQPGAVIGLESGVKAIGIGEGHTCAKTMVGTIKCWGFNNRGQVGDGTIVNQYLPVDVIFPDDSPTPTSTSTITPTLTRTYIATITPTQTKTLTPTPSVTVDSTAPIVVINQMVEQADPTTEIFINFTVTFNEPINTSTFTNGDITLAGTAGATTVVVSQIAPHNGTAFNIKVGGMTNFGTVTASLPAGLVSDLAGNLNTPSTSTDNSVTYDESETSCQNVPAITPEQDHFGSLIVPNDIDPYSFMVNSPYTTIVATLTTPIIGDFSLTLFNGCNSQVSQPWNIGAAGKRRIHIGDGNQTVTVRFNVGQQTGVYYLVVSAPEDGIYNAGQYKLDLKLEKPDFDLVDTLILYNPTRFQDAYGLEAASQMMDKLVQLAAHPRVNGLIMRLDQFQDVVTAYAAWDAVPVTNYGANVAAANLVSNKIRADTLAFMQENHLLATSYVVIIGDDHQIPFRRLPIGPNSMIPDSYWMDESMYYLSLPTHIVKTPVSAALMAKQTLSDDFYGDYMDRPWTGYWPSLAVGRLLDTPDRIQKTIAKFLDANGVIDMTVPGRSSAVAGYGFLADSARQACVKLQANGTLNADCSLINTLNFSDIDLSQQFMVITRIIAGYYGHTTHNKMFAANGSSLTAEQISAANLDPLSSFWWLIGCQSGLVFPENDGQPLSLVQALADHGITSISNTGWAWGADGPAVYSELFYQLLAEELTKGGNIPVGEALRLAKQGYFSRTINNTSSGGKGYLLSYYDAKVMAEATLYGLPMLEFKFPHATSTQAVSKLENIVRELGVINSAAPSSFTVQSLGLSELTYTSQQYNSGIVYISPGDNQDKFPYSTLPGKPLLPGYVDARLPLPSLGQAKGVMFERGDYTNLANNPLISSPAQLGVTPGSELDFKGTFPSFPVVLTSQKELDGMYTNALAIKTGQYMGDQANGILRLFNNIYFDVGMWSGNSNDNTNPTLSNLLTSMNDNKLHVQIQATDASGIYQVYLTSTVMANQATIGSWQSIKKSGDCTTSGPQTFGFDISLPPMGEFNYFIQVMDCAGNVSIKMNNEQYYKVYTVNFNSTASQDGWVLESTEKSSKGDTLNTNAVTFNLGDDKSKKQSRGILSFNTGASLPDDAVITGVTLKVKKQGITGGGNPVATFQGFMVDIKNGFFGAATLQSADFQTAASASYGPFKPALASNWYSIDLTGAGIFVNKLTTSSGLTQIRLRFKLDDNNNAVANYLSLYSGNAPAANRPQLVITYTVPPTLP